MFKIIQLELIGDGDDLLFKKKPYLFIKYPSAFKYFPKAQKPYVAEVLIQDNGGLKYKYLSFKLDYFSTDELGNRGIFRCYILEPNKIYKIFERKTRITGYFYFCKLGEMGKLEKMSLAEVKKCLNLKII